MVVSLFSVGFSTVRTVYTYRNFGFISVCRSEPRERVSGDQILSAAQSCSI